MSLREWKKGNGHLFSYFSVPGVDFEGLHVDSKTPRLLFCFVIASLPNHSGWLILELKL